MGAVLQQLPEIEAEVIAPVLADLSELFSSYGYTATKPAEGDLGVVEAVVIIEKQGKATLRVFPAWHWRTHYSESSPAEEDENIANWEQYQTELMYPRYVKIFYDGGPDSYTAVMYEDYVGKPGVKGDPHMPKAEFLEEITKMNANGMGVLVHVLGDKGASDVVDIFAEVRKRNGDNSVPMHLSHAWQIRKRDIERLAAIKDICIDFSPALNYRHPVIVASFVPPLGENRYNKIFPVRDAFEAGLPVGFGRDWSASLIPEPNAFHHMQTWVTRTDPEKSDDLPLNPEQSITLEQAVEGYTLGGAGCLGFGWEDKLGSIETGKYADFIVLDRNIFETPISKLYQTQVERTVLGGKTVYESN
jgi:predicted amidohydrolase YtcJ